MLGCRSTRSIAEGRSRKDLESDRVPNLALTRLVTIVGEAATRIPPAVRQEYSGISWSQIIGMRNRLIHEYDVVDLDVLWTAIKEDMVVLIGELEEVLKEV